MLVALGCHKLSDAQLGPGVCRHVPGCDFGIIVQRSVLSV